MYVYIYNTLLYIDNFVYFFFYLSRQRKKIKRSITSLLKLATPSIDYLISISKVIIILNNNI